MIEKIYFLSSCTRAINSIGIKFYFSLQQDGSKIRRYYLQP